LASPALITRHTLREERSRLQILLAEDNPVNQTLAIRLLEKRGYLVTVAGHGRAALAALSKPLRPSARKKHPAPLAFPSSP
jgi:two-component system, sensor histidine kinase and response regulator